MKSQASRGMPTTIGHIVFLHEGGGTEKGKGNYKGSGGFEISQKRSLKERLSGGILKQGAHTKEEEEGEKGPRPR